MESSKNNIMKKITTIFFLFLGLNLSAQSFSLIDGLHNSSEFDFAAVVLDDAMFYVGKDGQGYPGIRKYDATTQESSVIINSAKLGNRNPDIFVKANNGFIYVEGLEKEVFYYDGTVSSLKSIYKVADENHYIKGIHLLRDGFVVYAEQGIFTNKYSAIYVNYEDAKTQLLKSDITANATSFYQNGDIVCIEISTDNNLYFVNSTDGESVSGKDLIPDAICDDFSFIGGNTDYITYGCQNQRFVYDLNTKSSKETHVFSGFIFENERYIFSKSIPYGVSVTNKETLDTRYIDESNSATECISGRYHYTKRNGSDITIVSTNGDRSQDLKYKYDGPVSGSSARQMEIRSTAEYQGVKYSLMRQSNKLNLITYNDEQSTIDIVTNVCASNCLDHVSLIVLGEDFIVPKYNSEQGWEYFLFDPSGVFTKDTKIYTADIYPNPAQQFFSVKDIENIRLTEIFDVNGKKVLSKSSEEDIIDVSQLSPGSYFVKIVDNNNKKFFAKLHKI